MENLTTKQEAKARGLTRYSTGQACKHGHVAERLVSSGACVACMRDLKTARSRTREFKDARNARLIARRAAANPPKPCAICGTIFDPREGVNRGGAHTCGAPECTQAFYARNSRKKPDRECTVCQSPFASRKPNQFICSEECRETARLNHPSRDKVCPHCEKPFADRTNYGHQVFCSSECRLKHDAASRAAYHRNFVITQPDKHRQNRLDYRTRNPEQHRITTRNVNAKRIEREVAALAVAREMIPHTIKSTKGMRAKIKASREFLQSLGVERPLQSPTGENRCPLSTP